MIVAAGALDAKCRPQCRDPTPQPAPAWRRSPADIAPTAIAGSTTTRSANSRFAKARPANARSAEANPTNTGSAEAEIEPAVAEKVAASTVAAGAPPAAGRIGKGLKTPVKRFG